LDLVHISFLGAGGAWEIFQ